MAKKGNIPWNKGIPCSEETKKKISEATKGRKPTEETLLKISKALSGENHPLYGTTRSPETRKKISDSLMGTRTGDLNSSKRPEVRAKISKSMMGKNVGKVRSEETKQKISKATKGIPKTEETKRRMSIANKGEKNSMFGKHHTDEEKQQISKTMKLYWKNNTHSMLGKHQSDESKQKISVATSGENSASWRGGLSFEPYIIEFNDKFKEYIRIKYNRICFICGKTEKENKKRLVVHHVNYNKKSRCFGNEHNFLPLCECCHSKTSNYRYHYFHLLYNNWLCNTEIQLIDFNMWCQTW